MSHPNAKFMHRYLQPLVGCRVTEISETDGFPTIVFRNEVGECFRCDLSSDEEGNQPGFLFGLPIPKTGRDGDA